MFGLGFSEILVLGVLALVVIGPDDLPKVARTIGRFMNELKRGGETFKREFEAGAKNVQDDLRIDPYSTPKKDTSVHAETDKNDDYDQVHAPSPVVNDTHPVEPVVIAVPPKKDEGPQG